MSEENILRVSLKRKSIPVELEMEDGTRVRASLREMSGTARDKYFSRFAKGATFQDGKMTPNLESLNGIHARLLALCLFKEGGDAFTESELQEFPATVLQQLSEEAEKMNGLNKKGQEEIKNA